MEDFDPLELNQ